VSHVAKVGVYLAVTDGFTDHIRVADAATDLFRGVFGPGKLPARQVIGVINLPLDVPVELEVIFEVNLRDFWTNALAREASSIPDNVSTLRVNRQRLAH
jgi:hypothetical protein